jgi:hypothetical protein
MIGVPDGRVGAFWGHFPDSIIIGYTIEKHF